MWNPNAAGRNTLMAEPKKVRLKDVAERCKLNKATVSLILNDRLRDFPVRPETIELVKNTARDMGYVPSRFAQSLVTKRTRIIGYSFPFYFDPPQMLSTDSHVSRFITPSLLSGLIACGSNQKYDVICLPRDETKPKLTVEELHPEILDGLIWGNPSSRHREYVDMYKKNHRIVLIGRCPVESNIPVSDIDNYEVTYRLVDALVRQGARRIAYLCTAYPVMEVGVTRMAAFKQAMQDHGLKIFKNDLCAGTGWVNKELKKFEACVNRKGNKPDAIIVSSSDLLPAAMEMLQTRDPEWFRNYHVCAFLSPEEAGYYRDERLTVVEIDPFQQGFTAISMLIDQIEGRSTDELRRDIECNIRFRKV